HAPHRRRRPRGGLCASRRRLGGRRRARRGHARPRERRHRRLCTVPPRACDPLARHREISMTPKPYTHPDAVPYKPLNWTGLEPPAVAGPVPSPAAIVMDGNGRWANQQGLPRTEGHRVGVDAMLDVIAGAVQAGVGNLSVYAFSTENWKRSPAEVRFLMGFNREVLHRHRDQLNEWGVRVRWAGRRPKLWG